MAEDILKVVSGDIKEAEKQIKAAKELIDKLRAAGEDTTELELKYREAFNKLRRYKKAFGVE